MAAMIRKVERKTKEFVLFFAETEYLRRLKRQFITNPSVKHPFSPYYIPPSLYTPTLSL